MAEQGPLRPEPETEPDWPPPGTGRWVWATLAVALAIVVVQLFPYRFQVHGPGGMLRLEYAGAWVVLGQVLLFVPFGFVESRLASRLIGRFGAATLAVTCLDAALLSFICETAQHWIPDRASSLVDVVANVLGGVAGYLLSQHTPGPGR